MIEQQTLNEARQEGYVAGMSSAKKILDILSRCETSEVSNVLGVMIDALKGDLT